MLCSFLLFLLQFLATGYGLEQQTCSVPALDRVLLRSSDEFGLQQLLSSKSVISRVVEVNESVNLDQLLNSLWAKEDKNVMLLFYASWCPFSKMMTPLFNTMSAMYPSVYHFAVEESTIRPSLLSKYGVNSFPVLVHVTPKSKTRYNDEKSLKGLLKFYKKMTGIVPDIDGTSDVHPNGVNLNGGVSSSSDVCPYPRAIYPEKWIQDDMYLTLATCFLAFRIALYLLPVASKNLKSWWRVLKQEQQRHV